jgi:hypothetical protein
MPRRSLLLARQKRERGKRGIYVLRADAVGSGPRQALGLGHHIALGLDHRPRGVARRALTLFRRELQQLRRGHDPR